MPNPYDHREENSVTLVVIPHHGASLFQWRLPRYAWFLLVSGALGLLGSATWVLTKHIQYRSEISRLQAERASNKKVAQEFAKGKEAVMRVARLELELRKMLKFKSEKSLVNNDSVGGPTEEDVKHLTQLLDDQAAEAAEKASVDMEALMAAAKA